MSPRLLLSCGEASGDLYAGALTRELLACDPTLRISGLGGPRFAAAGGTLVDDYRDIAVTGLTEAIAKLPRSFEARRRLVAAAEAEPPDALILIDFPDFNFRLAPRIRRLGVPVVYYISPQIWAWRRGRLKTMRAIADRVLVIFPFEEQIYRDGGVPVEFVGHPLVDLAVPSSDRAHDDRDVGVIPIADPHGFLVLEVDAIEPFDECRHEVPARLLAVGHDVDAGTLLVAKDQSHGVALAFGERAAVEIPGGP